MGQPAQVEGDLVVSGRYGRNPATVRFSSNPEELLVADPDGRPPPALAERRQLGSGQAYVSFSVAPRESVVKEHGTILNPPGTKRWTPALSPAPTIPPAPNHGSRLSELFARFYDVSLRGEADGYRLWVLRPSLPLVPTRSFALSLAPSASSNFSLTQRSK